MHATSAPSTSSLLHILLSKALSSSLRPHLFPPHTHHPPPLASPIPFTLSVTTSSTDFNFALLVSPTAENYPLTFGAGFLHGPFASTTSANSSSPHSHSPSHIRFARNADDATSLEAYHLPHHDLLLLVLSRRLSSISVRSIRALFHRSVFLNILNDNSHHPQLNLQRLTPPLLYCITDTSRLCPTHGPAVFQCTPFSQPNPHAPDSHFATHMLASVGECDILATKVPFAHGKPQGHSPLTLAARTTFHRLSDPILARRLAQETHPPHDPNRLPLVELDVPPLATAPHHPGGCHRGVDLEHDGAEDTLSRVRIDDPFAGLDEQLGADFLTGMPGEEAPDTALGRGVHELAGLEFLGLPTPMLAPDVRNCQVQQMDFEPLAGSCEGFVQQSEPPQPTQTGDSKDFERATSGVSGIAECLGTDMESVEGRVSPSQELERSPSQSISPGNLSAFENEDPMKSALKLKAEIRKERNRASALRSNMRKRAIRDTMKMELQHCREKVELLRSREVLLRQENMSLRRRIMQGDGIVGRIVRSSSSVVGA